jgi:integrase
MCGERLARRKREKGAVRYPRPRTLADGTLLGQVMIDGRRETVKAGSEKEYKARIDALRHGVVELRDHPERVKLKDLLRGYIDANEGTLSPATLRGYEVVYKNRFRDQMERRVCEIDWQKAISIEGKSAKTVRNAWGLVAAAMRAKGIPVPSVNLPQVPTVGQDFLDFEQIGKFLAAVRGDPVEPAALLMLHSLRLSEALAVKAGDLVNGEIRVRGAVVEDKDGKMVEKPTNKNKTSARDVPILIDRLREIWPKEGPVVTMTPRDIRRGLEAACKKARVPVCSPHDLRRSFASLAYHLGWPERITQKVGGWGDTSTLRAVYYKLAGADVEQAVQSMRNYYQITTEAKNGG